MKKTYQEPSVETIDFATEMIMGDGENGTGSNIFDPDIGI